MNFNKCLLTLLAFAFTFSLQAQDPCEDADPNDLVCVELAPDVVVQVTACEALTQNLIVVDCDENVINNCDCDWGSEEFVCVDFDGQIATVHACELECFGEWLGDYDVVDCGEMVFGCTDTNAQNYDETATINDGSCEYETIDDCDCDWESEEFVCVDFDGQIATVHACELECFGEWLGDYELIECEELVYGCTDFNAENYDQTATVNDGSCEYEDLLEDCDCDWNTEDFICVDFDGQIATVHACELQCFGEWLGDYEVVECGELVYGCTDANAENYDETATVNDGSCEYEDLLEDCDCDWNTEDFICVDFDGQIATVHACELECFGEWLEDYEVVDCNDVIDEEIDEDIENVLEDFYGGGEFNQENFEDVIDVLIEFLLFPNPIEEGEIGIFVESNSDAISYIQITNGIGQVVAEKAITVQKGSNQFELNVDDLGSGIYVATIYTNSGAAVSERFIKK